MLATLVFLCCTDVHTILCIFRPAHVYMRMGKYQIILGSSRLLNILVIVSVGFVRQTVPRCSIENISGLSHSILHNTLYEKKTTGERSFSLPPPRPKSLCNSSYQILSKTHIHQHHRPFPTLSILRTLPPATSKKKKKNSKIKESGKCTEKLQKDTKRNR